ncbi:hypothetical protein WA588_002781, partial [Blastocystis sp. NMH]
MDLLMAENGRNIYSHYYAHWIELLTHFFVWKGVVETTVQELLAAFQRNGFVPLGIKYILLDMEKNKSIQIRRATKNKGWLSYIRCLFAGESLPNDSVIRCDYLLQHASRFIDEDLPRLSHTTTFLINCSPSFAQFITQQKEEISELDLSLVPLTDAVKDVVVAGTFLPTDYFNQSKQLLLHLQKGQDLVVAHFCADRGIGHLFHQNGLTALVLGEGDDAPLAQLGVYQVLARLRATVAVNEEEIEQLRAETKRRLAAGQKEEARMLGRTVLKLKKETEETRKRIQFLREQMNTLGDASLVKKIADVAKMTSEVLPKDIDVEKMEDLVDEIQSSRDAIKQTTDALVGGETSNGDEELQKVLNELDGLPTVPKESPQRERVSEMEA